MRECDMYKPEEPVRECDVYKPEEPVRECDKYKPEEPVRECDMYKPEKPVFECDMYVKIPDYSQLSDPLMNNAYFRIATKQSDVFDDNCLTTSIYTPLFSAPWYILRLTMQ